MRIACAKLQSRLLAKEYVTICKCFMLLGLLEQLMMQIFKQAFIIFSIGLLDIYFVKNQELFNSTSEALERCYWCIVTIQ